MAEQTWQQKRDCSEVLSKIMTHLCGYEVRVRPTGGTPNERAASGLQEVDRRAAAASRES